DVDAAIVIHAPPVERKVGGPIEAIERAVERADVAKPVVAVMLGSGDGPLRPGSSIPSFAFPEQAAAVLGRVAAYSRWRSEEAPEAVHSLGHIKPAVAGELIADHLDQGTMAPGALRALLDAYGVD